MSRADETLRERGRAALRAGDWDSARSALEEALETGVEGLLLEGLGQAYYGLRDYPPATSAFEQAFSQYREEGNDARAAFVAARWLAWLYGGVHANSAVSSGWLSRALRLLDGIEETAEHGWVALIQAAFAGEHNTREKYAREGHAIAERFADRELEFLAIAYIGECFVAAGRTEEGMSMLDETLAACSSGEIADFEVVGEIYCKLFAACERAHDVTRAEEWLKVVDDLGRRLNLIGFTAICQTHFGGILTAAGRWQEAEKELTEAARVFEVSYRALQSNPLVRLADLRIRQGRLEEAAQLLSGLDRHPDAPRPLAMLHLALGDAALAQDVLERTLAHSDLDDFAAAPLLALLVDVHIELRSVDEAQRASERLTELAHRCGGDYLEALAALARGRVCIAQSSDEARACLEEALSGFSRAQFPLEVASTRLDLARAVAAERPEVAAAEAKEALASFDRLEAARHVDAAAALLRSLGAPVRTGPKGSAALTKREAEILELIGHGLSNREIADRLYISPRTAEHHVGRILTKLGLRSRAEAAAYAVRSAQSS